MFRLSRPKSGMFRLCSTYISTFATMKYYENNENNILIYLFYRLFFKMMYQIETKKFAEKTFLYIDLNYAALL